MEKEFNKRLHRDSNSATACISDALIFKEVLFSDWYGIDTNGNQIPLSATYL